MTIIKFLTNISRLVFDKETHFVPVRRERKCLQLFRLTSCFKVILAFASYNIVTTTWLQLHGAESFLKS